MNAEPRQRVAVVTDSSAFLPPDLVERYSIHVVPLTLIMGQESWLDGVEIEPSEFYALLDASSNFPTTSQPNIATFQDLFQSLSEGYEGIVAVLLSSEISGTIASAAAAAANLPDIRIEIIDSRGTSMMLGFPALAAAEAAVNGKSVAEVAEVAQRAADRSHVYFVVDTLEYLHRGGRIGAASRLLGSALNLKPILELRDGAVQPVVNVRTQSKAIDRMCQLLEGHFGPGDRVHMAVLHVNARAAGKRVLQEVKGRFSPVEVIETEVSPVIGAHVGPGTVGVAFYVE